MPLLYRGHLAVGGGVLKNLGFAEAPVLWQSHGEAEGGRMQSAVQVLCS